MGSGADALRGMTTRGGAGAVGLTRMINISLDAIFKPRTIAVVGASKNKEKIGHIILHNLIVGGFTGKVYPVNREADVVHSIAAYPDVISIPGEVDLAVIAVPAKFVLQVIEECVEKKVKGVIVITAGFREIGPKGAEIEAQLLEKVRNAGIRMVGPNCMGVLNMDPKVSMAATFAGQLPIPGKVAFVTQSGAIGGAIIRYSRYSNIGISKFISLGNRADVSSNDMLSYLEIDEQTDTVAMYLEDIGNPKRFVEVARRLTRKKPVIVLKSGRTAVGARAVSSHTGALAGLDVAYDALFEMCGIIRADTVEEMFDMIKVFSEQPRPSNRSVVVLSNGGGPGILAADALISKGLKLPDISEKSREELSKFLVEEATLRN
ncbi:MAG: CoA-binding protein, partial [Planctomycetota bacterium]|nr:CoA-binding protein [Planctomycetota bacterium]